MRFIAVLPLHIFDDIIGQDNAAGGKRKTCKGVRKMLKDIKYVSPEHSLNYGKKSGKADKNDPPEEHLEAGDFSFPGFVENDDQRNNAKYEIEDLPFLEHFSSLSCLSAALKK
jgi:hypothetical protein